MGSQGHDEFLSALYDCVARDNAFPTMLRLLAHRFDCGSAILMFVDAESPRADIASAFGPIERPEVQESYRAEFGALDPLPATMARMGVGTAATTTALFATDTHRRFVTEFYHPLGFRESLGGPYIRSGSRFGLIAVHRGVSRPPFDDAEVRAFERLMSHVARALTLRGTFFQLESQVEALQSATEPVATALLLFDDLGILTHANASARAILARGDGLSLDRAGRLIILDSMTRGALTAALRSPPTDESRIFPVQRIGALPPYALRIAKRPSREMGSSRVPACIVIVSDPDSQLPDCATLLQTIYSLTPACAKLVSALTQGEEMRTYADRTGISLNTAKFHLKAAFLATGTHRQADLIRQVGGLVRDLARGIAD